jgi:hypothetical protein
MHTDDLQQVVFGLTQLRSERESQHETIPQSYRNVRKEDLRDKSRRLRLPEGGVRLIQINNLFQTKEEPENDKAGKELTTVFKNLIKKISIDPTSVGPKDYEDLSEKHPFFTHELTHIILLVCAAKTEATLCHLTAVIDKLQADDE